MACCFLPDLPRDDGITSSTSVHLENSGAWSQRLGVKFPKLPSLAWADQITSQGLTPFICKIGCHRFDGSGSASDLLPEHVTAIPPDSVLFP